MSVRITLDRDTLMKNLLTYTDYMIYSGYNDYVFDEDGNIQNNELNDAAKLFIAYKIINKAIYYTPIDTGKLVNSIYIKPYKNGYEIGYTCEYAIYVHEISFNQHKYPKQYKYLEDAAFEVINEHKIDTGIEINVTMEYSPLRIFVGVDESPGESITGIKANEQMINDMDTFNKMWNSFVDYTNTGNDGGYKNYFEHMDKFFTYYRQYRHKGDSSILREWIDRHRHK